MMKKLTAGIFATLVVLVSAGMARADIPSTEYVNGQLNTKESISNRVSNTADYKADDAGNNAVYPSVTVAEHIAHEATKAELKSAGVLSAGGDKLMDGFQNKSEKAETKKDLDELLKDKNSAEQLGIKKDYYPSVQTSEDIAHDTAITEISNKLVEFGLVEKDNTTEELKKITFQSTDAFVKTGSEGNALLAASASQEERESKYTSVDAVDSISRTNTENYMNAAGITRGSNSEWEQVELQKNKINTKLSKGSEESDEAFNSRKKVAFPSYYLTEEMIRDSVSGNIDDKLGSDFDASKLENTGDKLSGKSAVEAVNSTDKTVKYPSVDGAHEIAKRAVKDRLRDLEITKTVTDNGVDTDVLNSEKFFAPSPLVTALNSITDSNIPAECKDKNGKDCALLYKNGTWSFEPIVRGEASESEAGAE